MLTILSNVPVWVFPLLLGLILLGLRSTRDRTTSPVFFYALPFMGFLTVNRASGLAQADLALAAVFAGAAISAFAGYALQGRWIVARLGNRVQLRGEWLTMATILGVFSVNFAAGMTQGMNPALASGAGFALVYGLAAGLFSGLFLGRALRVARWPAEALA